jgi:bifunctional UDP-N-acetylglucosamine pyrophosphorylase / glucosamine-1-phosphate N-acetyltransferase
MNTYATVVLAAGKGTRMRSTLPKVLHPLAGMPLLGHVLNAVEAISSSDPLASYVATTTIHRPVVVLGYEAAHVEAVFGQRCLYTLQEEQLGTGHAVLAARPVVDELNPQQ